MNDPMTDTAELFDFPCRFPIKAMGRQADGFEALVTGIVRRHAELWDGEDVRVAESAEGRFVSVTVTIQAESREQLDRIYMDLTACDQVLMAL